MGNNCLIYLNENHPVSEHAGARVTSLFTSGGDRCNADYQHSLSFFKDVFISAGGQWDCALFPDRQVLLVPITGEIQARLRGRADAVDVEEAILIDAGSAGVNLAVVNPSQEHYCNFLAVILPVSFFTNSPGVRLLAAPVLQTRNQLQEFKSLQGNFPFALRIGVFDGRREAACGTAEFSQVFILVLSGAFEVEGRLLHERDCLLLGNTRQVEVEALSNGATIVILGLKDALRA
jgi:quercetin 2,3-dioxygenase